MSERTAEQISYNMKRVKNKDSEIELLLRGELWKRGLRYTKSDKRVTGKPDIVFFKKKVAVFCDSEFWHGYDWEIRKNDIKSNRDFWVPKIERNMERDAEVNRMLLDEGWIVIRFWGKEIKADTLCCADRVEEEVRRK